MKFRPLIRMSTRGVKLMTYKNDELLNSQYGIGDWKEQTRKHDLKTQKIPIVFYQ